MKMIKRVLLLLACALAAGAQTLVGLPEYGIALRAYGKSLALDNHSGKTIIATFVCQTHANGKQLLSSGYHLASIPDGKSLVIDSIGPPQRVVGYSDSPVSEIRLYAVVFSDGELRGEDPFTGVGSFQNEIEKKFRAINETGRLTAAGDWLELNRRAELGNDDGENHYAKKYAEQIVAARNGSGGEPAAQKMAEKFQGLPEHLWRTTK